MIPTTFDFIAERAATYPVVMRRSQMSKEGFLRILGDRSPVARKNHVYLT